MSPSSRSTKNVLNRLAHEAIQFNTIYRVPARTNTCPPASRNAFSVLTVEVTPRPSRALHNELNSLASQLLQFGTLYHEIRIPVGPKPHGFLSPRPSKAVEQKQKQTDLEALHELNRLARLVELSSRHTTEPPVYPVYTPLAYHVHDYNYGKGAPAPVADKLRSHLKLSPKHDFSSAFPNTTIPKFRFVSGSPRFEKSEFNTLLKLKLDQSRRFFKLNHTPKCYPRLVTSWICSLFKPKPSSSSKQKPAPVQKKKRNANPSEQNGRNNLADRFVSASQPLAPPPQEDIPAPVWNADIPKDLPELAVLDVLLSAPTKTISGLVADPSHPDTHVSDLLREVDLSSLPSLTPECSFDIRELRSAYRKVVTVLNLKRLTSPFVLNRIPNQHPARPNEVLSISLVDDKHLRTSILRILCCGSHLSTLLDLHSTGAFSTLPKIPDHYAHAQAYLDLDLAF
jgi:hypothetical protein